jgi:hypothetical protein
MVGDLTSEAIKVKDVYDAGDRRKYIATFGPEDRPDPKTRLTEPRPLGELGAPSSSTPKPKKKAQRRRKSPTTRTSIVPSGCAINPTPPRINNIFNELATLDADTYPNAGAVLLRDDLGRDVPGGQQRSRPIIVGDTAVMIARGHVRAYRLVQ